MKNVTITDVTLESVFGINFAGFGWLLEGVRTRYHINVDKEFCFQNLDKLMLVYVYQHRSKRSLPEMTEIIKAMIEVWFED